METIRLWITGVASAAVIGSVILALTPDGGAEKTMKTMVSVFLIFSMIVPFADDVESDFEMQLHDEKIASGNSADITDIVAEQFKNKLSTSIEEILAKNGIQAYRISIDINTNEDEISVENITVVLKKESESALSSTKKVLEKELNVNAMVLLEGAED